MIDRWSVHAVSQSPYSMPLGMNAPVQFRQIFMGQRSEKVIDDVVWRKGASPLFGSSQIAALLIQCAFSCSMTVLASTCGMEQMVPQNQDVS